MHNDRLKIQTEEEEEIYKIKENKEYFKVTEEEKKLSDVELPY